MGVENKVSVTFFCGLKSVIWTRTFRLTVMVQLDLFLSLVFLNSSTISTFDLLCFCLFSVRLHILLLSSVCTHLTYDMSSWICILQQMCVYFISSQTPEVATAFWSQPQQLHLTDDNKTTWDQSWGMKIPWASICWRSGLAGVSPFLVWRATNWLETQTHISADRNAWKC